MRLTRFLLLVMLFAANAPGAHAALSAINMDGLFPAKDAAQVSEDLKVLETVAEEWSPEWQHELSKEEAVSLAERTLRKIEALVSAQEAPAGELLLLKGLTAHYAYNLDQDIYFDVAADALHKARKALPADCRPLWFLGNHYAKSADAEDGVPLLKQAVQECGEKLPLAFWEDFAYAAVLAAMPATGQYSLDQVKARNGGALTEKVRAVDEGVKKRLVAPLPDQEYEREDIWRVAGKDETVRLVNGMYGFMIDVPEKWGIAPFGVRNGRSGIGITLPKKGKRPPLEVAVFASPASAGTAPEKTLRAFLAKTLSKRKFSPVTGAGSPGHNFLWLESRPKKGSRIVAGILRRGQPPYPGLLLESPHNIVPEQEEESPAPRYFTPVQQLTRLPGDLDYLVMIEGAPAAFDRARGDVELLLRNLVIE